MNVITYSCGHLLYTDSTTVVSKLNSHFRFGAVVSIESNLNIEKYGSVWEEENLTLVNYHKEVMKGCFRGCYLRDMPALPRDIVEKLSLDRCHLYNMHRNESLTFRELDREIMNCFQYWNFLLEKFKIDLFLCHGFPHSIYTYSLYAMCKARNIKVFYMARSCVPGYSYWHDDLFAGFDRLDKAYEQILGEKEPAALSEYMRAEYVEKLETDSYEWKTIKKEPGRGSLSAEDKQRRIAKLFQISQWGRYIRHLRDKIRQRTLPGKTDKYYRRMSCAADLSKRYIYVPLQMQPESTTSPMGNIFVDFVLMVKILADCVRGTDIQLYVKEHNAQTKKFRLSRMKLYDELREIPGVKLIRKEESSFKLQENCIVTATCSGTVVMESLFKGKPVLVFGNRIHNSSPSACVVSDTASCKKALDDILEGRFSIGKKERDAFLAAVEKVCFRGCWFVKYSDMFGISQDEAAENTYLDIRQLIEEWRETGS